MLGVRWSPPPLALPFIPQGHLGCYKQYGITPLPLRTSLVGLLLLETIGLEIRLHKQVTHTQRHMNNAWSEIVSSIPCLALYSSWSPRLLQTIWDNSAPTTDQPCRLITTLLLLVLHFYDYEQPNAPLPTLPLCE